MKSGRMFQIRESDIDQLEWMRVARGYEVKVLSKDGAITKFGGFKETVSMMAQSKVYGTCTSIVFGRGLGGGIGHTKNTCILMKYPHFKFKFAKPRKFPVMWYIMYCPTSCRII